MYLIHVSEARAPRAILDLHRTDALGGEIHLLLFVPPIVEPSHVEVDTQDQTDAEATKGGIDAQRGNIIGGISGTENVGRHQTRQVGHAFDHARDDGASALVGGVVVEPSGQ